MGGARRARVGEVWHEEAVAQLEDSGRALGSYAVGLRLLMLPFLRLLVRLLGLLFGSVELLDFLGLRSPDVVNLPGALERL